MSNLKKNRNFEIPWSESVFQRSDSPDSDLDNLVDMVDKTMDKNQQMEQSSKRNLNKRESN